MTAGTIIALIGLGLSIITGAVAAVWAVGKMQASLAGLTAQVAALSHEIAGLRRVTESTAKEVSEHGERIASIEARCQMHAR